VAVQPIRLFGDPVLRTPAEPVTTFDKELRVLVRDLVDTMTDAPGVGLAAPQIGVGLRVFTYHVDEVVGHLINPSLDLSDDTQDGDEGCLSFPGLVYPCTRSMWVVAKGFNEYGDPIVIEGSELLARCVQHETDHLNGVLFIDRLEVEQRKLAMRAVRDSDWTGDLVRVSSTLLDAKTGHVLAAKSAPEPVPGLPAAHRTANRVPARPGRDRPPAPGAQPSHRAGSTRCVGSRSR